VTRTLRDLPAGLAGKRGLVRVDYNVPLDAGQVADATRIEASLPTLRWLLRRDVRPVLLSHLGRPGGRPDPALSLAPVAGALAGLLDAEVLFSAPCDGEAALRASCELTTGQLLLTENTRFLPGETANDDALAGRLARLGDFFVNDAFGTLHRAHASTTGVPALLSPAAAGLLVERELEALGALDRPRRPFVVAFGGAKIGDKIELMRRFVERADRILVGGAMANTFLRAQGFETGTSLVEEEALDLARSILAAGEERIRLPTDVIVLDRPGGEGERVEAVGVGEIEPGTAALDIGPESRARYAEALRGCAAFFWNGQAEYRAVVNLGWERGNHSMLIAGRHISPINSLSIRPVANGPDVVTLGDDFGSTTTWDAIYNYRFGAQQQGRVSLNVQNLTRYLPSGQIRGPAQGRRYGLQFSYSFEDI
jgi:phosphoglycerate kinase